MSKLDDILSKNIVAYETETARPKLMFSVDGTKRQIKELMLDIIINCSFAGELNNDSSARRHKNGIADPKELMKRINEL